MREAAALGGGAQAHQEKWGPASSERSRQSMIRLMLICILTAILFQSPQTFGPDADGFIRNWLVLAPIAVQEDSGATEIEKDFIGGEAAIQPKPGDKVNVNGKILAWTPNQAS